MFTESGCLILLHVAAPASGGQLLPVKDEFAPSHEPKSPDAPADCLPTAATGAERVGFSWLVAFGHKVCESEDRAFSDETTFSPAHSDDSDRFDQRHATGAASKIGRRTNLCLSWSTSRRRP